MESSSRIEQLQNIAKAVLAQKGTDAQSEISLSEAGHTFGFNWEDGELGSTPGMVNYF